MSCFGVAGRDARSSGNRGSCVYKDSMKKNIPSQFAFKTINSDDQITRFWLYASEIDLYGRGDCMLAARIVAGHRGLSTDQISREPSADIPDETFS